jgi:hydrogenase-4 component B
LILRHHRHGDVGKAAFLFLVLGEVGFALIVAAFAILGAKTGSLEFSQIAALSGSLSGRSRGVVYVLVLAGFGIKAGLVPFHIWLPEAHPAAPADGSGFLSGLLIKLGFFGVVLFAYQLLPPGPAWWGILTMGAGALSAVVGILYALLEKDLKRFLAFSSIENMGIIFTALGASLTFRAYGQSQLATFLLLTALYHALNHGTCKTLLFLEAGVIERAAGTRDMDRLGGLVRALPASAVIFLTGALGMAALPPLNGFVSEWMLFQGLFQGFRIPSHLVGILIVVAGAAMALAGGLAISAFIRAFGIPFLGMPRSARAREAKEIGQPVAGPGLLATICVVLGVGAPIVLTVLDRAVRAATGVEIRPKLLLPHLTIIPAADNFSGFSPTYLAAFLVAITAVPILIFVASRPRARSRVAPVWDGGIVSFRPRMQYTASAFANPVRVTFDRVYQPEVHVERASDDPAGRSGPVHYHFRVAPLFERLLYRPIVRGIEWAADTIRPLQSGDVNLYLLYVFLALLAAFLIAGR